MIAAVHLTRDADERVAVVVFDVDDGGVTDATATLAAVGEHELHDATARFATYIAANPCPLTDERVERRIGRVRCDGRIVDTDRARQVIYVKRPPVP
jgi:hypothetical protein